MQLLINDEKKTLRFYDYAGRLMEIPIGNGLIELIEIDKHIVELIDSYNSLMTTEKIDDLIKKGHEKEIDNLIDGFLELIGKSHPYFTTIKPSEKTYNVEKPSNEMIKSDLEFFVSIKENIEKLREIVYMFFDKDFNNEIKPLSVEEKLFIFEHYWTCIFSEPSIQLSFTTGFQEKPTKENMNRQLSLILLVKNGKLAETASKIRNESIISFQLYKCSVIDACYIEMVKMITLGITVKKCNNCGKYFVMSGRSDTEYCDRIAPGYTDKTCKGVGPLKAYVKRIENNPLLLAYQKEYKAKHAALRRITNPVRYEKEKVKLKQWRISAKESAKKGVIIEEFKKWLK